MTTPVRLQLSRKKGFDLQAWSRQVNGLPAVSVARPGEFGNRFAIEHMSGYFRVVDRLSREQSGGYSPELFTFQEATRRAVDACRRDLEATLADPRMGAFLRQKLDRLRGKNGACWCALCTRHAHAGKAFDEECRDCSPCHCDPLLELANRPICEEVG